MARRVSGKRYAQAAFELALEKGDPDQWAADLELVHEAVLDEEFRAFLKHAEVPVEAKSKAVAEVLRDVHPLVRNLVGILVARGLVDVVPDVWEEYTGLLDEYKGRQRAEVTSAVELEPPEKERIVQFVSNLVRKEVVVSTRVDESILGGVVVQIGDKMLDGSTRSRLEALRENLVSETAAAGV